MKNIRTILLAMALTTASGSMAQSDLQQQFANPPQEARPRVWWHWMNGNISKYGIKKDLEWMHRAGIAGIHVFDAGLNTPQIVPHRITYMTPEWKDCFRYAVHIADSLGMTMAIPSSTGWSNTGGPWVTPHDAMKKITWRAVRVKGGKKLTVNLPGIYTTTGHFQNVENTNSPETFSQEIGVVAVRMPDTDIDIATLNPTITVSKGEPTVAQLTDGDYSKGTRVEPDAEGNIWAQYTFEKPVTIKALSLSDGNNRSTWNSWSAPLYYRLETSNDGKTFTKVCDIPQSGTFQQTIDLPPTTARCFRVVCQLPQKDKQGEFVNLMEYNLYTTSRINFAEEKAGFTSFGDLDQYPSRPDSDVCFHLTGDIFRLVVLADVAADVGVEQQRVFQPDAVLAEAADADIQIDARALVHHAEGNGTGRAVLVARQLLGVEVVDALILGGFAAEGEALADVGEHVLDAIAQITGEDARLGGHIVGVFARLCAHIHHLALLHDEHALAVRNGDHAAVGDDVVVAVLVAGPARGLFPALYRQHVRGDGLAIEVFLPLVGQHAASCAQCRFNESHSSCLLFCLVLFEMVSLQ